MGSLYYIGCESCGYDFSLMEGVGFHYHNLDTIVEQLSLPHRTAIDGFRSITEVKEWRAHMQIYECAGCQDLSSHLCCSIASGEGDALVLDYRCIKCFSELKPVYVFDRSRHRCPNCGKQTLGDHPLLCDGDWD